MFNSTWDLIITLSHFCYPHPPSHYPKRIKTAFTAKSTVNAKAMTVPATVMDSAVSIAAAGVFKAVVDWPFYNSAKCLNCKPGKKTV